MNFLKELSQQFKDYQSCHGFVANRNQDKTSIMGPIWISSGNLSCKELLEFVKNTNQIYEVFEVESNWPHRVLKETYYNISAAQIASRIFEFQDPDW